MNENRFNSIAILIAILFVFFIVSFIFMIGQMEAKETCSSCECGEITALELEIK